MRFVLLPALARSATVRYVWIIDDDVMPGNLFLQQLSHVAGVRPAGRDVLCFDPYIAPTACSSKMCAFSSLLSFFFFFFLLNGWDRPRTFGMAS